MRRPADRPHEDFDGDAAERVRQQIAMLAARMIAEDGLDYAGAKRRAAKELFGGQRVPGDAMPANTVVEAEVRAYQELFQSDSQPKRLLLLRRVAIDVMEMLAPFNPYLVGAVLNGTAGDHTDIHLQLFCDSAKDVEIFLINRGIEIDVEEGGTRHGGKLSRCAEEVIQFLWRSRGSAPEGIHLSIYHVDDLRGARVGERKSERCTLGELREQVLKENHE
jgi:hypothetical protein